jgi:hypothetical protein
LAHQAPKDSPRSDFHEGPNPPSHQQPYGLVPLYCARDLANQSVPGAVGVPEQSGIDVLHHGHGGRAEGERT